RERADGTLAYRNLRRSFLALLLCLGTTVLERSFSRLADQHRTDTHRQSRCDERRKYFTHHLTIPVTCTIRGAFLWLRDLAARSWSLLIPIRQCSRSARMLPHAIG